MEDKLNAEKELTNHFEILGEDACDEMVEEASQVIPLPGELRLEPQAFHKSSKLIYFIYQNIYLTISFF